MRTVTITAATSFHRFRCPLSGCGSAGGGPGRDAPEPLDLAGFASFLRPFILLSGNAEPNAGGVAGSLDLVDLLRRESFRGLFRACSPPLRIALLRSCGEQLQRDARCHRKTRKTSRLSHSRVTRLAVASRRQAGNPPMESRPGLSCPWRGLYRLFRLHSHPGKAPNERPVRQVASEPLRIRLRCPRSSTTTAARANPAFPVGLAFAACRLPAANVPVDHGIVAGHTPSEC